MAARFSADAPNVFRSSSPQVILVEDLSSRLLLIPTFAHLRLALGKQCFVFCNHLPPSGDVLKAHFLNAKRGDDQRLVLQRKRDFRPPATPGDRMQQEEETEKRKQAVLLRDHRRISSGQRKNEEKGKEMGRWVRIFPSNAQWA